MESLICDTYDKYLAKDNADMKLRPKAIIAKRTWRCQNTRKWFYIANIIDDI